MFKCRLPRPKKDTPNTYTFNLDKNRLAKETRSAADAFIESLGGLKDPIEISESLRDLHPLAKATKDKINETPLDDSGLVQTDGIGCFEVCVAPKNKRRALLLLDALAKRLEKLGLGVTSHQAGEEAGAYMQIDRVELRFSLEEQVKRTDHIRTLKKKAPMHGCAGSQTKYFAIRIFDFSRVHQPLLCQIKMDASRPQLDRITAGAISLRMALFIKTMGIFWLLTEGLIMVFVRLMAAPLKVIFTFWP